MCCVLNTIKCALKVVAVIVLVLGIICVGVGLWAILGADGPLASYLGTHEWVGIQIVGGLLVGAGAILVVDFVLAIINSTKLLSGCCLPLFFIFALVTTLIFAVIGIVALTVMGDLLRTSLQASFKWEADHGVQANGALLSAQKDFTCCGMDPCTASQIDDYERLYQCSTICTEMPGCVDAVMDQLLPIFSLPLAIGSFLVAGITCFMFILAVCMCCL